VLAHVLARLKRQLAHARGGQRSGRQAVIHQVPASPERARQAQHEPLSINEPLLEPQVLDD